MSSTIGSSLASFFNKWKDDTTPKITIAHFGDSHIQPGIFSGEVRKFMQNQKGDGGYGIIFPYSAAKTYSPLDYRTVHYGKWQYSKALEPRPRLPLGVFGHDRSYYRCWLQVSISHSVNHCQLNTKKLSSSSNQVRRASTCA
ncbi:MAG: hypothetical protein WDO15_10920 [Bacteroidota bacterium]